MCRKYDTMYRERSETCDGDTQDRSNESAGKVILAGRRDKERRVAHDVLQCRTRVRAGDEKDS